MLQLANDMKRVYLAVCLSVCPSVYWCICLVVCVSVRLVAGHRGLLACLVVLHDKHTNINMSRQVRRALQSGMMSKQL